MIITIIFITQTVFCGEVKLPDNGFIKDWQKSESMQTFYKNDLYGHIDGGAELFLEFGFDSLLVQDYANGETTLSLEVYCMNCPEAALGIYMMKCGQETPSSKINARNSINKYQALVVKNDFYIQLNNFRGNAIAESAMPAMLNNLLLKIPDSRPVELLTILPKENKISGSEKIIRGQYGLQPIFTFGEGDILQLDGKIFGAVAGYRTEDDQEYTQIIIQYPDKIMAKEVFNHLINNLDPYLKILDKNENDFIFQDYKKKFGKISIVDETIFIMIHLLNKPSL